MEENKNLAVDLEKEKKLAIVNYVLAKFLARFYVLEEEEKILAADLQKIGDEVKQRKIQTIINNTPNNF